MSDFLTRKTNVIWTSPSGKVFELKTNEGGYKVKHKGEIKTTPQDTKKNAKKIANSSDTFIDMGVSGKDLVLDFVFIGNNHDIEAETFENALCETGKSRLKLHYGKEFGVNVIEFSKKYSVTERINSTIINVNFHQTSNSIYPESTASKNKNIKNMAAATNTVVAENIADIVSKNKAVGLTSKINSSFSAVLSKISNGLNTFNSASLASITSDIGAQVFTNNAFTMASQLQQIMLKAASATSKINNLTKMKASSSFGSLERTWNSLINDLTNTNIKHSSKLTHSQVIELAVVDMGITSAISAIANSAIDYDFKTRKEAMKAAVALINFDELRNEFINEQESKINELNERYICDSGISEVVNAAADAIIEKSFDLKIERTITLAQDTSIIELAYKYYQDDFKENPEETIDFLISSNSLNDDEFFMLKRGRVLKLYV